MDRKIETYKASPIRPDKETPSLAIFYTREAPEFKSLEEAGIAYRNAAEEVVGAMAKVLPGGLFDAILVEMMKAKVSLFRVPHFTEEGG